LPRRYKHYADAPHYYIVRALPILFKYFIVRFVNDLAGLYWCFSGIILSPFIPSGKHTYAPKSDEEIDYSKLNEAYHRYGLSYIIKGIQPRRVT
jgi:hypothetical protein